MLLPKHQIKRQHIATYVQGVPDLEGKRAVIKKWKGLIEKGRIFKRKEESIKDDFIKDIFVIVLGYDDEQLAEQKQWHLEKELKTQFDGKKPDASIGYFSTDHNNELIEDVRMVVEIKGPQVNLDKKQNRKDFSGSPVDQAFGYSYRVGSSCKWVMVTNLLELRLYRANDINQYHQFNLSDLGEPHHKLDEFLFYCGYGQLFLEHGASQIETLYGERQKERVTISNEFYRAYHDHRSTLFFTLLRGNPNVPWKHLFASTQKLIDRIIFICFVRDLDLVGNVLKQADDSARGSFDQSTSSFWREILHLFDALDKGYRVKNIPPFNGGLFRPDEVINNLHIIDEQIEPFVKFASAYDFHSQLDVNILGHIFEQSISDLEELKSYIQEQNPILAGEVKGIDQSSLSKRKKDGVYYTPDYITRYMVQEAVGRWLDDRKREILANIGINELPEPTMADYISIGKEKNETIDTLVSYYQAYEQVLSTIKVLDPACGSGAFLTQVFDYLYAEWKTLREELINLTTPLQTRLIDELNPFGNGLRDEWKIKKSIVLNNLYGVDLNPESVEITKLSLWLKTANRTESLADLTDNIRQGNSLISQKKYAGEDAFHWHDNFPEIMSQRGFDIIVGNPPYVRAELHQKHREYFKKRYTSYEEAADLFILFYEMGINLIKENGYLAYITNDFSKTTAAEAIREIITSKTTIKSYLDLSAVNVFQGTTTYPVILTLKKGEANGVLEYFKIPNKVISSIDFNTTISIKIEADRLDKKNWNFVSSKESTLLTRLNDLPTIRDNFGKTFYGVKTALNEAFIIRGGVFSLAKGHIRPIYEGKDMKKWLSPPPKSDLIFFPSGSTKLEVQNSNSDEDTEEEIYMIDHYPEIYKHLKKYKTKAQKRYDKGEQWWELRHCAYYPAFQQPKIIFPNLQSGNKFSYDDSGAFINAPAVFLPTNEEWLVGVLNSNLIWYFLKSICVVRSGGYIEVKPQYFEQIPMVSPSVKDKNELVRLTQNAISLTRDINNSTQKFSELVISNFAKKEIYSAQLSSTIFQKEFIDVLAELGKYGISIPAKRQAEWLSLFKDEKRQSDKRKSELTRTESEIDQVVYRLYGLGEEEIKIVKQGVK